MINRGNYILLNEIILRLITTMKLPVEGQFSDFGQERCKRFLIIISRLKITVFCLSDVAIAGNNVA